MSEDQDPHAVDLARVNAALRNTKPQPGFEWCAVCGANKAKHEHETTKRRDW